MVKAREVNKDIRAIAEKVKTAVFSYDEIHNESIKNEFHYDYELVIKRVSEAKGWNREQTLRQLCGSGILAPLPNGEYKIVVGGTTKGGGGINYHGMAFFTLANEDYQVKYHELAHSLQKEYKLFSEEKIDKLYRTSAEGIKEEKVDDKQINKGEYKLYLNEMHSESFSYAAIMLRAENPLDFVKQAYNAYNTARFSSLAGFVSFGRTEYGTNNENNTKFYSTFPVMKETIKTIIKIRQQGKAKDFFDKNGVLKDEKLAKLCEQVVIKSAYSPRTLNSFFKYRVFDGHNDNEHGWRKDVLKGVATAVYSPFIMLANEGGYFSNLKKMYHHNAMEKEEKKKINQLTMTARSFDDPETQALYDYIQVCTHCSQLASVYKGQFLSASSLIAQSFSILRYEDKTVHEPSIRYQARISADKMSSTKKEILGDEMISLRFFVRDHKDNPYFCHLVQKNMELSDVIHMYNEKLKNPDKKQIEYPVEILTYQPKENNWFAINGVRNKMFSIRDFAKKFNCSDAFKQALVNLSLKDCATIDDPQIRKNLADSFHYSIDFFGIRKRRFNKKLNKTLDDISQKIYDQRNNLSYESYKKQFEGMNLDEILSLTKEHYNEERAKHKKEEKEVVEDKAKNQPSENREIATKMIVNNLEAINYLADRYGLSDKIRTQLQKMTVMPAEKQENKQLRKALINVVHIDGDWFGKEKRAFKKDFNRLMDSFVNDAYFQKDNPAYAQVCTEKMQILTEQNKKPHLAEIKPLEPVKAKQVIEPQKSPKEQVIDKLKSWGIEEGTYMILTPDDNAYRSYGSNETRSINTYFVEGKNDVKKTGADVVYGTNNGLEGAYFAEGVYVVACNDKLREMLYRKGKDTGLSVLLSNGEHFKKADGRVDDDLNNTWISAKDKAQKINQKMEKEAEERQAHVAKSAQNTSSQEKNGATCVAETFQSICDISDKLEPTGKLKNKIAQAYVQNNQELLSLEFWGNCAKQFADKCPAGKDTFVREVGKLGLAIGKDMKENADNPQYNAVKKRCADDKDADSMLKTAQACAKRTTMGTDMHMDIAASR